MISGTSWLGALQTVKIPVCDHQKYMIKFPIQFVKSVFQTFFHFECIPLCMSRILFSSVKNTIIFVATFWGFVDYKFKFGS